MATIKAPLLIPVENQVRELDPKLLLACIAAKRGFSSIIGFRRELHFHIPSFRRSIYLSKSITAASDLMFGILRNLGHEIVAWDEEALVHLPPETYYSRRLSPVAMGYVAHFFAWGQDNAELWHQYPRLPSGARIHITGNPRNDLLRHEMRPYYENEVNKIRDIYGDFILINTNFNHVNAFSAVQNLFQPVKNPGEEPKFGRAARGMSRKYAEGLRDHKQAVFEDFQRLIPDLDQAFPDHTIVVRPHPTESQDVYNRIAAGCKRVRVNNEGNVVPWLMATKALIHNGCTTGVEAFAMRVPAITYRASVNEHYDFGFYRLPNLLSHQCADFEQLRDTLGRILAGRLGSADGHERQELFDHYLAALDGPMACERILDVIEEMMADRTELPRPGLHHWLKGRSIATIRTLIKHFKARLPGSHNRPAFQRHRYPQISIEDMRTRVKRFQQLLGESKELKVENVFDQFFRISAE
jgi:surface carbohydrate biosynthesis protein